MFKEKRDRRVAMALLAAIVIVVFTTTTMADARYQDWFSNVMIRGVAYVKGAVTLLGDITMTNLALVFDTNEANPIVITSDIATTSRVVRVYEVEPALTTTPHYLLTLDHAGDGTVTGDYIQCRDNAAADSKFTVQEEGNTWINGAIDVDGNANISDTTAGSDVAAGNSMGNITLLSDNFDLGMTNALDDVFQLNIAGGNTLFDIDLGTTDAMNIGDGTVPVSIDGNLDLLETGGGSGTADLDVAGYAQFADTAEFDGTADFDSVVNVDVLTASLPVFSDASKNLTSSGTVPVTNGGTGAVTLTDHSVLVGSGTDAVTPLTVGTDGQLLVGSSAADPVFATLTADDGLEATTGAGTIELDLDLKANGGAVIETKELAVDLGASAITGTLAVTDGGTGAVTLTDHTVLVGSGTDAVTPITAGTTGQVLRGSTGADPSFGALDLTVDVTGSLPVTNGGTGAVALTDHTVLVGSGTDAVTPITAGTNGQLLIGQTGADPAFTTVGTDMTIDENGAAQIAADAVGSTELATTDVTAAAYTAADITIDADGRITAAANGTIDLTAEVSGSLPVTNGGTGAVALTDHTVLVGSGTDAVTAITAGTNNQVLKGSTGADPAFGSLVDADVPDDLTIDDTGSVSADAVEDKFLRNDGADTTSGILTHNTNQKVVGTHEANAQVIEQGTATLSSRTVEIAFATAFSAAPVVIPTCNSVVTSDSVLYVTGTSTTTCDITMSADSTAQTHDISWVAVGDAE